MQPEIHKLLLDIQFALLEIQEFTAGMNLSSYQADSKSKAAVERKFEIIGEACSRIRIVTQNGALQSRGTKFVAAVPKLEIL